MRIDPHVHCRDGRESYKETIAHVFKLCDEQGVDVVFDMPNTEPPLLSAAEVEARLKLVPREARGRYRLFVAATADEAQLQAAAALAEAREEVVGLKLYAARSVGNLGVITEADQQQVYCILAAAGYKGVLAVHCEKEALFTKAFDPQKPRTHSQARPPAAEINSIKDQIGFARAAGFQGTLHICHVSTAEGIEVIRSARRTMKITCGATPHHLLWSAPKCAGLDGLLYKVNPPLREPADSIALRQALKDGDIDWIETDHAPHPICEKLYPPYASGFPSLCLYRHLVEETLAGWGLTGETIANVTCHNIKRVFGERKIK